MMNSWISWKPTKHTLLLPPIIEHTLPQKTFVFSDPLVFAPDEGSDTSVPSDVTLYELEPCIRGTANLPKGSQI